MRRPAASSDPRDGHTYTRSMLHARRVGPSVGHSALRHPFVVAIVALAIAGAGYFWSSQQDERFTATTRLFLSSSSDFDGVGQSDFVSNPDRYAVNQAALALSTPVLNRAINGSDLGVDAEELRQSLDVAAGRGNDVIVIDATAASPGKAAQTANAVAEAYRSLKLDEVERQTEQLTALSTTEEDRAAVLKRAAVYGDGIELTEEASAPTEPSHPQPVRDGLLALIAGLAAGVGVAVAIDAVVAYRARRAAWSSPVPSPAPTPASGPPQDMGPSDDAQRPMSEAHPVASPREEDPTPETVTAR